jgi:hypothetical protein
MRNLQQNVIKLPFFTEQGMGVIRILTDRGTEYRETFRHSIPLSRIL